MKRVRERNKKKWLRRSTAVFAGVLQLALAPHAGAGDLQPDRHDQLYGTGDGDPAKWSRKMDIFKPNPCVGKCKCPAMILIHGGGLVGGHKEDVKAEAERYTRLGFAVFSIDYRVANPHTPNSAPYPAAFQDVEQAVKWVKANARADQFSSFTVDPNTVVAAGVSAGATLAAHLAVTQVAEARVKAAVEFSGIMDFNEDYRRLTEEFSTTSPYPRLRGAHPEDTVAQAPYWINAWLGCDALPPLKTLARTLLIKKENQRPECISLKTPVTCEGRCEMMYEASPSHYLKGASPIFAVHGTEDPAVSFQHAQEIADLARQVGGTVKLKLVPGSDHNARQKLSAKRNRELDEEIARFLRNPSPAGDPRPAREPQTLPNGVR